MTTSGRVLGKQFHSSYAFLTFSRPTIRDVPSFDIAISSMVSRLKQEKSLRQADIQYYGCMEAHEDGNPHFHVLLALSKQVCWSYESARERFSLPENFNDSVNIVVPEQGQSTFMFVRNHVNYMQKQAGKGDFIGKVLSAYKEARDDQRKEYDYILSGLSRAEVLQRLRKLHPEVFLKNWNNVASFLQSHFPMEVEYPPYEMPSHIDPNSFVKPDAVFQWEKDNLLFPCSGRRKCLILIGRSRTGKTEFANWLASQYGVFSSFDFRWAVEGFRQGHRLAVLNDMAFFEEYRPILGCQSFFSANGRYGRTLHFKWGSVPSIWTFNEDNSILKWSSVDKEYLAENAVIVRVDQRLYRTSTESG